MNINQVVKAFLRENGNDLPRASHSLKVYGYAKAIAAGEVLTSQQQQVLEAAALLHDVGIHPALHRYGHCDGPAQEELGPPIVRRILSELGWPEKQREQVAFLVGHHHSYHTTGGGLPLQILFEADLLVNAEEGAFSPESLSALEKQVMRTETGRQLFSLLFGSCTKEKTHSSI